MSCSTNSNDSLAQHFADKLSFETDPSDVHAAQHDDDQFVLVDARGDAAWAQGRIPGARHMPVAFISARALEEIPLTLPVVTYCWGPGCNGSTRAALEFAKLGYQVKEMIGGFEYWAREGYAVEIDSGPILRSKDPLTAPLDGVTCDC